MGAQPWSSRMSTSTISALPLVIVYLFLSEQFIKGLTAGAVKG